METSNQSIGETLFDLMLYVVDTPASRLAQLDSGKASKTQDTFGLGYDRPLANYDPDTQSWKMLEAIYLWGECPLLENLPPSGMTQSGALFLQPLWEHIIDETVSSLWPTPTTHPENSNDNGSFRNLTLLDAVKRSSPQLQMKYGTPSARDGKGAASFKKQKRNDADLTHQARKQDGVVGGSLNPMWVEWLMGFPIGWTDLEA
jgi:hypothetical protein